MPHCITFTADDLGLNEPTNLAIERAHQRGVLNAASLMMGQLGSSHALEVIGRNPELEIGWHFHACDSRPLTRARWPWGTSPHLAGLAVALLPSARSLVRRELQAQWAAFLATGVRCRFLNGHHHLHIHPWIARQMHECVQTAFTGWVRGFKVALLAGSSLRRLGYRLLRQRSDEWLSIWWPQPRTDTLWGLDRTFRMNADEVQQVLPTLGEGHHEFLFHPRAHDDCDQRALIELRHAGASRPRNPLSLSP